MIALQAEGIGEPSRYELRAVPAVDLLTTSGSRSLVVDRCPVCVRGVGAAILAAVSSGAILPTLETRDEAVDASSDVSGIVDDLPDTTMADRRRRGPICAS